MPRHDLVGQDRHDRVRRAFPGRREARAGGGQGAARLPLRSRGRRRRRPSPISSRCRCRRRGASAGSRALRAAWPRTSAATASCCAAATRCDAGPAHRHRHRLRPRAARAGPDARRRAGRRRLWVSGTIGDGALGLLAARGRLERRAALEKRYRLPQPRSALGPRLVGIASAAADVSDGLLADAGHIAEASRLARSHRARAGAAVGCRAARARGRARAVGQRAGRRRRLRTRDRRAAAQAKRRCSPRRAPAKVKVTAIGDFARGKGVRTDGRRPAGARAAQRLRSLLRCSIDAHLGDQAMAGQIGVHVVEHGELAIALMARRLCRRRAAGGRRWMYSTPFASAQRIDVDRPLLLGLGAVARDDRVCRPCRGWA